MTKVTTAAIDLSHRPRHRSLLAAREAGWGLVFLSPWIIGLVLFTALPMLASLVLSFTNFDLVHPEAIQFVGLRNYQNMLRDPVVMQSLGVTASFAILSVPLGLGVSLGLALLLNHRLLAGKRLFRTLFFMPIQIPLVASTFIWLGFLNGRTGWLTYILEGFGIPAPDWFSSTTWALPGLALMGIWGIGNMMLIFLAGLQSVPTELYEAARVDGARRWSLFRHITLPMISPVFFYNLLISLIAAFQYFTQAYVVSNGSGDPGGSTLFFNLALYREAFVFNQMGYGSALAWLMFAIVLGLSLLLFRSAGRWVYYAASDR